MHFGYRKKVSVSVSAKSGTGKKYRYRYRQNLVPEKSIGIGIVKIWYRKKVSVSVSKISGTGKKYRYRYRSKLWVPSHSGSHRCIPENDKYQVCTGGVPCPPCPCPPRSCSPCPCSPCPLSIVHVHHAHVHNVHCPCPLVMSLILTRWRNLVAKFLTNASCATWWPTQPPQGFCEIWENER